jgi:glycosyltransferase involved in cell wall biosynthesis
MRQGIRVNVILHGDGPLAEEAARLGAEVIRLPKIGNVANDDRVDRFRVRQALAAFTCRDTIRKLDLDIVHVNDLAMLRTWGLATRFSKAHLIAHWRSNYRKSWSVDVGLRGATRIIAISDYNKAQLPDWAQAKAVTVYNPCGRILDAAEQVAARAKIRGQLKIGPGAKVIGIFGSHTERKRTHVLADVLNGIPATAAGDPVLGLACGKRAEPYDKQLDEKIQAFGLQERLIRPGQVRPVEEWMAACDLILAPAEREPFGRTALEAAQVGVPILMSADSGAREIIDDGVNGRVIDPRAIDQWVAVTRELLEDGAAARRMADSARARLAGFLPQRHAEQVIEIYRDICARRAAA